MGKIKDPLREDVIIVKNHTHSPTFALIEICVAPLPIVPKVS